MPASSTSAVLLAWNSLLQEIELARNYHMPYVLDGFGNTFRNPLLDFLLPSLLYVKMVAVFDEALKTHMRDSGYSLPKRYKRSLHGRIEFLNDQSDLANYTSLHEIRDIRNLLAHESSETTTWVSLSTDLDTVEKELQHLEFIADRPEYKYFGERSAMRDSEEPGISFEQDFEYGVRLGEQVVMKVAFTRKTHESSK